MPIRKTCKCISDVQTRSPQGSFTRHRFQVSAVYEAEAFLSVVCSLADIGDQFVYKQ